MELGQLLKKAKWITAPAAYATPVIVRKITLSAPTKGSIAISALGFFVLYINGKRVGSEYFLPSNSLFRRRDFSKLLYPIKDSFTYRSYYWTYDVSAFLQAGVNTLEIALGDGWYRQKHRIAEGDMSFGDALGAIYDLRVQDEGRERAFYADGSETCRTSATVYSQLFTGEIYDARIDSRQDYSWGSVSLLELPETELTPDDSVPDRIVRRLEPVLVGTDGTRKFYDAGENISGFVTLSTAAAWGEKVIIRFAENMKDGQLDFQSTGAMCNSDHPQIMEDCFIGDGQPHVFTPMFVWHAFRYFEVEGDAQVLSVDVVHSDIPVTASFSSSSEELNWLYHAFIRTQLNNMHCGVPMDCPHRERLGYTGDGQVCAPTAMLLLDAQAFYRKWIRDIFDSQDAVSGHVNHTAPFGGGGGGPGGWGCAAVLVPYEYYRRFGDINLLKTYYSRMRQWIVYLMEHCEDGLVVREEPGGWCLGDWCTLEKTVIPAPFVNTCYMLRTLRCMEMIAKLTGNAQDVRWYAQLRMDGEKAVCDKYYDRQTGSFADGIQGADAFALWVELGDDRTLRNLKEKYSALGYFDTGFLGTDILCQVLIDRGEAELVFKLLTARTPGSFGYMMDRGATTVWETWTGRVSHDHPMFGACVRQLFSGFLGIKQKEGIAGFRELIIKPQIPRKLQYASGSLHVQTGTVSVAWRAENDKVCFEISIPQGVCCDFVYGGKHRTLCEGVSTFTERVDDVGA